jgi:NAD(P)-dependent dehydrogenase (short-subunit alcohol dehydrogenase family)
MKVAGKLEGRRIVVTGAASGMGAAIAKLFAAEDAALALLDRNADGVRAVADEISSKAFACDVSDRSSASTMVAKAGEALGGIDGVVNAAGILITKQFDDLDPESWDRMIAVNLTGPYNIVRAALPMLRASPRATIVNIASVGGLMPMAGLSGYSASKAGLAMFTKGLAFDLGPNIRANTICPGVIKTEMTRYLWENPEHTARAEDRVALKRLGVPEDVARAALFFSTEDSGFTTGTELPVDGGFSWR